MRAAEAEKLSPWQRLVRWVNNKRQQRIKDRSAYEKHMKPTTRLLLVILAVSCLLSFAIVIFAVLFIWNYSSNKVNVHLQRDALPGRSLVVTFR